MKLLTYLFTATVVCVFTKAQVTGPLTTLSDPTSSSSASATTSSETSGSQEGCPTVTLTSDICSTCATPDCVQIEPLTQSCDCPEAIPTVFISYPCGGGCGAIGCAANYVFFTENCTQPTSTTSAANSSSTASNSTGAIGGGGGPIGNGTTTSASATGIGSNGTNSSAETTVTQTSITGGPGAGGASGSRTTSGTTSSSSAAAMRIAPLWAMWL